MQLGKIAPLVDWYQDEIGFSLVLIGWFTSMIGMFVALAALPAGWAIERFGPAPHLRRRLGGAGRRRHCAGAVCRRRPPSWPRGWSRAGLLVLVIAMPALLTAISPPLAAAGARRLGRLRAVGYAVADFWRRHAASADRNAISCVAIAAFAMLATWRRCCSRRPARRRKRPAGTAQGFCRDDDVAGRSGRAGFRHLCGLVGRLLRLPADLCRRARLIGRAVGRGDRAAVPLGNFLASLLVRGSDAASSRFCPRPASPSTRCWPFPPSAHRGRPSRQRRWRFRRCRRHDRVGAVCQHSFHRAARWFGVGGDRPRRQAGGIGTVFGPPLAAYVIETYGFAGFGWFLVAIALVGIACLVPFIFQPARRKVARRKRRDKGEAR